jgi:hypothetical protein
MGLCALSVTGLIPLVREPAVSYGGKARRDLLHTPTRRGTQPKGHRMITADIHAELIAAFLGDDEPCYGECQCAACRASIGLSNPTQRIVSFRAADSAFENALFFGPMESL